MRADVTQAAGKSNAAIACEVSAALTSSLVLEDVLADVARRITEALDVWECDLYEYYPENGTLVCSSCWCREMTQADRDWVGTVLDLEDWPTYRTVLEELQTTEDYIDDDVCAREPRAHGGLGGEGRAVRAAGPRRPGHRSPDADREAQRAAVQRSRQAARADALRAGCGRHPERAHIQAPGGAEPAADLAARLDPRHHVERGARGRARHRGAHGCRGPRLAAVRHLRVRQGAGRHHLPLPLRRAGFRRGRRRHRHHLPSGRIP